MRFVSKYLSKCFPNLNYEVLLLLREDLNLHIWLHLTGFGNLSGVKINPHDSRHRPYEPF